jgi:hypothetical protein
MAWPRILGQCVTGLVLSQAVLLCLLALKKSVAGPLLMLPLPFISIAFHRAAAARFWRPMAALSLMSAAEIDGAEAAARLGGGAAAAGAGAARRYVSPSFDSDAAAHAATLEDCARAQAVLAGGEDEKLFARVSRRATTGGAECVSLVLFGCTDVAGPCAPGMGSLAAEWAWNYTSSGI